jgi:hypothetical protein
MPATTRVFVAVPPADLREGHDASRIRSTERIAKGC